jgi:subtilisin family serine protease
MTSINDDNDASDDNGHGTSCAGIAAASGNNGIGVAGVNWGARIMPLRALGPSGGSYQAIANSIIFAVDNGADVISMSLGGSAHLQVF